MTHFKVQAYKAVSTNVPAETKHLNFLVNQFIVWLLEMLTAGE